MELKNEFQLKSPGGCATDQKVRQMVLRVERERESARKSKNPSAVVQHIVKLRELPKAVDTAAPGN